MWIVDCDDIPIWRSFLASRAWSVEGILDMARRLFRWVLVRTEESSGVLFVVGGDV